MKYVNVSSKYELTDNNYLILNYNDEFEFYI